MKTILTLLTLILLATTAHAKDVTLAWDPNTETDLSHYTIYQADSYNDRTGPWAKVTDIAKGVTTFSLTVEDGKNFAWYVTASDASGNKSGASNMVWLYDRNPPEDPKNVTKTESDTQ